VLTASVIHSHAFLNCPKTMTFTKSPDFWMSHKVPLLWLPMASAGVKTAWARESQKPSETPLGFL